MKKYILFLFLLILPLCIAAQNSNATKPVFQFTTEVIDYGKIEQYADGDIIFEFRNIGGSPLVIKEIKTSCGCTIPKKPTRPIMPGEKGTIEVSYDTSKTGGFIKQITLFSNAKQSVKRLKIKGFVSQKKPAVTQEKEMSKKN